MNLAKHNYPNYNEVYVDSAIENYCTGDKYSEFVADTKAWLKSRSAEELARYVPEKFDLIIPANEEYYLKRPSDTISENSFYSRKNMERNITLKKGSKLNLESNYVIKNLTLSGTLASPCGAMLTCDSVRVSDTSVIDVDLYCGGIFSQSGGSLSLSKALTVKGDANMSGSVEQKSGRISLYGDLTGGSSNVKLANLYLNGKLNQSISRAIDVNDFINNNAKKVTINSGVTVNGKISCLYPMTNGKNITLTETASFADDTFVGDITIAGLSGELPSKISGTVYLKSGEIKQISPFECTSLKMSGGTLAVSDCDTTITGVFSFGAGTINLTNANLTVKNLQKTLASGGTINIDADSSFTNKTDAVIAGTITGDGAYYIRGDLINNGTINVGNMVISALLPVNVSGNNINTKKLSIAAPGGVTIGNKIYASESYTTSGKVVNPTNIIFTGENGIVADTVYTVPLNVEGDLVIDGKTVVAKDAVTVKGNIIISNGGTLVADSLTLSSGSITLTANSTITVKGIARLTGTSSYSISIDETSQMDLTKLSIVSSFASITNNGVLRLGGDTSISSTTLTGSGSMYLRGDLISSSLTINRLGELVLNGKLPQIINCSGATFDNITIENPSRIGVTFNNTVYYYENYKNNGNKVTGTVSLKEE